MLQVESSVWKPYFYFLILKGLFFFDLWFIHPPSTDPEKENTIDKCNWINISVQKTFATMPQSVEHVSGARDVPDRGVIIIYMSVSSPPPPEHLLKCVLVWTQSTSSLNTHSALLLVQKNNAGVVAYITVRPQCYAWDKWSVEKKKKKIIGPQVVTKIRLVEVIKKRKNMRTHIIFWHDVQSGKKTF